MNYKIYKSNYSSKPDSTCKGQTYKNVLKSKQNLKVVFTLGKSLMNLPNNRLFNIQLIYNTNIMTPLSFYKHNKIQIWSTLRKTHFNESLQNKTEHKLSLAWFSWIFKTKIWFIKYKKKNFYRKNHSTKQNVFLTRNVKDKIMKMLFKTKWNLHGKKATWIRSNNI